MLEDMKNIAIIYLVSTIISLIILGCLGYFVYSGIEGSIAIIVVSFVYGVATLIALIPYVGFVIQAGAIYYFVWPWVSELTKIQASWLTTLLFGLVVIYGFTVTFVSTSAVR
jgi:hypothetical protein